MSAIVLMDVVSIDLFELTLPIGQARCSLLRQNILFIIALVFFFVVALVITFHS